jgi:hypothetical protein
LNLIRVIPAEGKEMNGTLSVPEHRAGARETPHFRSIEFELEKHSTLVLETMVAPVEVAGFHEPPVLMGLGVSFSGGGV